MWCATVGSISSICTRLEGGGDRRLAAHVHETARDDGPGLDALARALGLRQGLARDAALVERCRAVDDGAIRRHDVAYAQLVHVAHLVSSLGSGIRLRVRIRVRVRAS